MVWNLNLRPEALAAPAQSHPLLRTAANTESSANSVLQRVVRQFDLVEWNDTKQQEESIGSKLEWMLDSPSAVQGRQDFVSFDEDEVSDAAKELATQMTEYPTNTTFSLDGFSMEQLAQLCGGIARNIQEAYVSGALSEQEYENLNEGLSSYTEFMTAKAETKKAAFAVMQETAATTWKLVQQGASKEDMAAYAETVRETWQEKIDAFLKDHSYDRAILNQMIDQIRGGQTLSMQTMA